MPSLPPTIVSLITPFRVAFARSNTFTKASFLVFGVLLCKGGRTVCSALRILGLQGESAFGKYHNVLNRARVDMLRASRVLLGQIAGLVDGPLILSIDGHLERRRGDKIEGLGFYRDSVRSSKNYTVISAGLRWLPIAAIVKLPFMKRSMALPFLTVLAPSEEYYKSRRIGHRTIQRRAAQAIRLVRRWLPKRKITLVADGEFATAELVCACKKSQVSLVSRLRLNARLFAFPPPYSGTGRPRNKGTRLQKAVHALQDPSAQWLEVTVDWYGGTTKRLQYTSGACLWHVMSHSPMPIRYVLVRDPDGVAQPCLMMSSDPEMPPKQIIEAFVARWQIEVTFREAREHLGVETQRQWSARAIQRSTPVLFGLYSLVVLLANELHKINPIRPEVTTWYKKTGLTFSDLMAAVRENLLREGYFCNQRAQTNLLQNEGKGLYQTLINLLARAA